MIQDTDKRVDAMLRLLQIQRESAQDAAVMLSGDLAYANRELEITREDKARLSRELIEAKDRLRAQQIEIESLRAKQPQELIPATGGEVINIGAAHA